MTDKLIMTTAQRDNYLQIMRNNMQDPDAYDAIAELQSLPMVIGELVASVKSFTSGSYHRNYQLDWYKDVQISAKLYTSPQALTPMTADDVADKVSADVGEDKEQIAIIYNAVIKHRSEAK